MICLGLEVKELMSISIKINWDKNWNSLNRSVGFLDKQNISNYDNIYDINILKWLWNKNILHEV